MTFVKRRIDVTITLGSGQFGDEKGDTVTLTGYRVVADVAVVGGDAQGQLQLQIYGMPLDLMNQLTTIGPIMTEIRIQNRILVAAGDDGSELSVLFEGTIDQAYANFQTMPEVVFNISALSALGASVKPVGAKSYKGSTDVAAVMKTLADEMGFAFENNGVDVKLASPYFPGTSLQQVKLCARAAGINYSTDRGVLAIWPQDGARGGEIPLIAFDTGLVGYPAFSSNGLVVTTLYIPTMKQGGQVDIESTMTVASGRWNVATVLHSLSSERVGGPWFTQISCYRAPT
ncbi:baseplate hub protein [Herbaspirillum chlorophenolicum]|uniref:Baseplate hub protein n=1 Tax=Herbaspirillum chlorophenolicum TaxID=211589 RepID=A0ABW8F5E4_9BURK